MSNDARHKGIVVVSAGTPLFRVHRSSNDPVFFCSDGKCRFDPPDGSHGACYVSTSVKGAFLEKFGRLRIVPRDLIDEHSLSVLYVASDVLALDLTERSMIGAYGYDASLQVGSDYKATQALADKLVTVGLAGVHYAARHDPALRSRSIAVFGEKGGSGQMMVERTTRIPEDAIAEIEEEFGVRALHRSPLSPNPERHVWDYDDLHVDL